MSGVIKVDEIEKSSDTGTGIKLNSPLLNSSGTEIMSAAGGDPTSGSHIATKNYVDSQDDTKVNRIVSVDNTFPRFDGTTGQLINSYITTDADGNILYVNGKINSSNFYSYNVYVSLSTPHTLRNHLGSDWTAGLSALVHVGFDSGTGTDNMNCLYLVRYAGSNTNNLQHIAGNSAVSSNRPYMDITGGLPTVKTNHTSNYLFGITVIRSGSFIG